MQRGADNPGAFSILGANSQTVCFLTPSISGASTLLFSVYFASPMESATSKLFAKYRGCTLNCPKTEPAAFRLVPAFAKVNIHRRSYMPISKDLLDILVCPECKTPLRPLADSANGLQCETCRRIYPIRDDIPVLIIDQATKAVE